MTELAPGAITTADLFRELSSMATKLAVIESQTANAERIHQDHEFRLRSVERFRWALFGAASMVGALSGVASGLLAAKGH